MQQQPGRELRAQEEMTVHIGPNTTVAMIGSQPITLARDKAAAAQDGRTIDKTKEIITRISVGRDREARVTDKSKRMRSIGFRCFGSMDSIVRLTTQHGNASRTVATI